MKKNLIKFIFPILFIGLLSIGCNEAQTNSTLRTTTQASSVSQSQVGSQNGLSNDNHYINSSGNEVHSPAYETNSNVVPQGATAKCGDGTYSFSQHRSGTCSHHGGVSEWLY